MTKRADLLALAETLAPVRVQLSRKKGWRMPSNTVKVDRTNKKFGNIFTVGCVPSHFSTALPSSCESVEDAVECFRYYAETWMDLTNGRWIDPLIGKNLACWCAVINSHGDYSPCHADVLLSLANDIPMEEVIRENTRRAEGEAL